MEVGGNNRSVMPFDVLGRTRATLMGRTSFGELPVALPSPDGGAAGREPVLGREVLGKLLKPHRAGNRPLQLLVLNEEFLVSAGHQLVLITSLPFVHTARRSYRLDGPVKMTDVDGAAGPERGWRHCPEVI